MQPQTLRSSGSYAQTSKFYLFKNLEKYDIKSCSHRHSGRSPAEAMPKSQISPPQKLRGKNKNKNKYKKV